MNYATARLHMVESQIRPNGVRDPLILDAFASLPRELFVPEQRQPLAYIDKGVLAVEASGDEPARYLLQPMVLARLLEAAEPSQADNVLDVGSATGYSAAILSRIVAKVDAVETSAALVEAMKKRLSFVGASNVDVHEGPLEEGVPSQKPFSLILVNGAVANEPKSLFGQLADGGRLVVVVRKGWMGSAWLFEKSGGNVSGRPLFDAPADYLPGFEPKPEFTF
ncbi:protein-L-isoaspartate O-methyltransferase [Rhodomicrobium sp. Az07]|uniref:protein-L-isoaspartate O-methyltransferase family protein n=1 Tax=Rhodomicrobium sp. Az07 TaxID=2839034 RepID=UPI001BEB80D0|nr:protein-L-isoaspartate O-methyltransferase [Rhodomicrobium sp. Az07]MBT3070193.1 protein-L-isoaspartate O-methyltransferase [Rhodomicrobium sp. Az07]